MSKNDFQTGVIEKMGILKLISMACLQERNSCKRISNSKTRCEILCCACTVSTISQIEKNVVWGGDAQNIIIIKLLFIIKTPGRDRSHRRKKINIVFSVRLSCDHRNFARSLHTHTPYSHYTIRYYIWCLWNTHLLLRGKNGRSCIHCVRKIEKRGMDS